MTPDDVAARARELGEEPWRDGPEVDVTIRGRIMAYPSGVTYLLADRRMSLQIAHSEGAMVDLVSIELAPLRVEPGALYRNGAGELLRGDHHGGLQGFDGYIGADEITADSELVRVRVVEA